MIGAWLERGKSRRRESFVRAACYMSIASMLMMVWSVLDPRPIPVLAAMSLGQLGALLAFALFLAAALIPHKDSHDVPEEPEERQL